MKSMTSNILQSLATKICSFLFRLGISVSVEASTLVFITIERYLAICHPLFILRLRSFRYSSMFNPLMISSIWLWGFFTALPNFFMYDLCYLPTLQRYKCQKVSSNLVDDHFYIIAIDSKKIIDLHPSLIFFVV